jgi:two-component system cell cycle sensor histidine kinase/response regulator CckA
VELSTPAQDLQASFLTSSLKNLIVLLCLGLTIILGLSLLAGIADNRSIRVLLLISIPLLSAGVIGILLYAYHQLYQCHQAHLCSTHVKPMEDFLKNIQFNELFNAAPAGDILLDANYKILHYNTSFAEKFLQGEKIEIAAPFIELINPDDRAAVLKRITPKDEALEQASPFEFQLRWGLNVVAYANVFPYICSKTGQKTQGVFLQLFDNSEQKINQQRLAQSQKTQAMGQLAGGIAHDFNNLLTAMIGFCDLMLMRHTASDPNFSDIMQIKQNANRAANLVRQLLAFSRQQALQPKILDITEIMGDLSVLLQRLIGSSIPIKITQDRQVGLVKVDEGQFEQVIMNLVVNARDAIGEEGEIHIHTFNKHISLPLCIGNDMVKPGDYVVIEVADNGSGIEPAHLGRIFDPFFSTKAVGSGTGLGLAMVQGIIKQTGGYIAVNSTVGQGTRFQIYLPQYQGIVSTNNNILSDSSTTCQIDLTGSGTILLIEDEDAVRMFSARALKDKGYRVIEAANGEEGYNYLCALHKRGEPPVDLVITDVVMPLMDGPTLARKALEMYPELKIIFISGYAEDSFRKKLGEGEVQFLPKPFSLKELAEKTKRVMESGYNCQLSRAKHKHTALTC